MIVVWQMKVAGRTVAAEEQAAAKELGAGKLRSRRPPINSELSHRRTDIINFRLLDPFLCPSHDHRGSSIHH